MVILRYSMFKASNAGKPHLSLYISIMLLVSRVDSYVLVQSWFSFWLDPNQNSFGLIMRAFFVRWHTSTILLIGNVLGIGIGMKFYLSRWMLGEIWRKFNGQYYMHQVCRCHSMNHYGRWLFAEIRFT